MKEVDVVLKKRTHGGKRERSPSKEFISTILCKNKKLKRSKKTSARRKILLEYEIILSEMKNELDKKCERYRPQFLEMYLKMKIPITIQRRKFITYQTLLYWINCYLHNYEGKDNEM